MPVISRMKVPAVCLMAAMVFMVLTASGIASISHAEQKRPSTQKEWVMEVRERLLNNLVIVPDPRMTGVQPPELRLIVRRNGTIAKTTISRSSGEKIIDEAVLDMVKRAGRLPPFARDMKGKHEEIILAIDIGAGEQQPAPHTTSKGETVYEALGFRLELPAPFEISQTRRVDETSIYIDITSRTNEPPPLGVNGKNCTIGLNVRPPEEGKTQDQLNADDVILKKITAKGRSDPSLFGTVESTMVFDHEGVRGIAHTVVGGIFTGQTPELREYEATMDRPEGSVTVSCWTTATAMPYAIAPFQKIAESIRVSKD